MTTLRDKDTGAVLGNISSHQLRFLFEQLEEESDPDPDYYLNRATLELLAHQGADPQLLGILRDALGDREEMEIEWLRSDGEVREVVRVTTCAGCGAAMPETAQSCPSCGGSGSVNGSNDAVLAVSESDAGPYREIFKSTRSDVIALAELTLEGARIPFTTTTLNPFTGLISLSVPIARVEEGSELLTELEGGTAAGS